jgi:putative membrane protein
MELWTTDRNRVGQGSKERISPTLLDMKILLRVAGNALAAWLTVWLVPGLSFDGEWWWFAVFGLVLGLVNAFIKPIAKLLTLPLRILTLGLFTLVVNVALMGGLIWLGERADVGLRSDGFGAIVLGGLALTVIASILDHFID